MGLVVTSRGDRAALSRNRGSRPASRKHGRHRCVSQAVGVEMPVPRHAVLDHARDPHVPLSGERFADDPSSTLDVYPK